MPGGGYSEMGDDPHDARKPAFDDEPLYPILMFVGQFQGRDASQRPSHDPEILSKVSPGELGYDLFQNDMAILNEVREGGNPAAGSITPVIGNDQVHFLLVIEGRDLIIIAHHFTVSVEEKDPGPFLMTL